MSDPLAAVRRDFDEIARVLEATGSADTLQPSERALLSYLPRDCGDVLEFGCGHGALTRQVARRARSVVALDLSPEMIRLARVRSSGHSNIDYRVADITQTHLPVAAFDVVISVAAVHHVPLTETVERLAAAVRPGGWLLIQDLVARRGLRRLPVNALAWLVRRLRATQGPHGNTHAGEVANIYREHGRGEHYLTPAEAARIYAALLPHSRVIHHLEWRYTAIWHRDAQASSLFAANHCGG